MLFKNCTSSECGGAVRVTASATKILIESTDFSSCSSSNDFGGSLYLINAIDCIIYRICSVECSLIGAKSYGQFAYMCVCDTSSNKNIGVDLSISNSINDHDNACDLFYSRQGNVSISSMNASHNRCYYYSGYFSFPSVKNSEITGSLLFSSFINNTSNYDRCIGMRNSANHRLEFSNIISNKQSIKASYGTIFTNCNINMKECCIINNNAQYYFCIEGSMTITLTNCTLDESYTVSNKIGNVVTKSNPEDNKRFMLKLHHIATAGCSAEYPDDLSKKAISRIIRKPMISLTKAVKFLLIMNHISENLT